MTDNTGIVLLNSVVVVATVGLVLGLMALTGSWHSLWGLLLLLCTCGPKDGGGE